MAFFDEESEKLSKRNPPKPQKDLDTIVAQGQQKRNTKKRIIIITVISCLIIIGVILVSTQIIIPNYQYSRAISLYQSGEYEEAENTFLQLGDFKDSSDMVSEVQYAHAMDLYENENYERAAEMFEALGDYKNAVEMRNESKYNQALINFNNKDYEAAIADLNVLTNDEKAASLLQQVQYEYAKVLLEEQNYKAALSHFKACKGYQDTASILDSTATILISQENWDLGFSYLYLHNDNDDIMKQAYYDYLIWQMRNYEYENTAETFEKIRGYRDTLTNDMFAGAQLLAAGEVEWFDSQFNGFSVSGVRLGIEFTPNELEMTLTGLSVSTYSTEDPVNVSDSWKYRFDGRNIYYLSDSGEYLSGGTIGRFSTSSEDENIGTVVLTLDLPGMMSVTDVTFEYEV